MNPNLFTGKLYDGNTIGSTQRKLDSKFRHIVHDEIFRSDIEKYKKSVSTQYHKPNEPVTLQRPIEKLYISKSDLVEGQLKNMVTEGVESELKTIKKSMEMLPRVRYLEREVNQLQHDVIQLRKALNSMK
jgi:hypothetical protein